MRRAGRMYYVDALRSLSILYIVCVWHIDDYVNNCFYTRFTEIASCGALNIFVFISGVLIIDRIGCFETLMEMVVFLKKRLLRIYPLFAATLLLYFVIVEKSLLETVYALLMTNMFVGNSIGTYWFVGMLVFYNIIVIWFLHKFSWKNFFWKNILVVTFLIAGTYLVGFDERLLYFYPSLFLCFLVVKEWKFKKVVADRGFAAVCFGLCLIIAFSSYLWEIYDKNVLHLAGFLMVLPLYRVSKENFNFHNKYIELLSYSSFCIYLLHRIVYKILLLAHYPEGMRGRLAYLVLVGIPLVIGLSFLLQYSYDRLLGRGEVPADYRPAYWMRGRRI